MEPDSELHRAIGTLFVVSGPSGVGKDTVLDGLSEVLSGFTRSVSATTRAPRPGEVEGRDYYFFTPEEFEAGIAQGDFLEWAEYNHRRYGTPRSRVERDLAQGVDVILKIEVQGGLQVKRLFPEARLVFIQPPSFEALEARLRLRQTDSEARVRERLAIAQSELALRAEYHYLITNDDLKQAIDSLRSILIAERCRIRA